MYQISAQIGEDFAWAPISLQQGLGIPDRLGFTQTQAPAHCSFPTFVHGPEVQAFINTFLLNKTSANTTVARDGYNTDLTKWVTWTTPRLD